MIIWLIQRADNFKNEAKFPNLEIYFGSPSYTDRTFRKSIQAVCNCMSGHKLVLGDRTGSNCRPAKEKDQSINLGRLKNDSTGFKIAVRTGL